MGNRQSERATIARCRDVLDPTRRFVDLAVQFEIADGPRRGAVLEPYGGRWDLLKGGYVGRYEPGRGWYGDRPVRVHTVRIAEQCVAYVEDWDHHLLLAEGGRRSGKTTGALAPKIVVCMIVFAGLPGEVLSPTYRQTRNVRKAILLHTPPEWWRKKPPITPPITMEMVHGSTATLLTAANEDSARSEGVAWGAYDERQDIPEEAFGNALLSSSEAECAPYIFETATVKPELRAHHDTVIKSASGHVYPMDSFGNPFTSKEFLDLAMEFLDEETIDREIHARWPELFGRIYGCFDRQLHVHGYPLPDVQDATAAILGDRYSMPTYGPGAPQWYCSIDPPSTAGLWKLYADETLHLVHEVLIGADGEAGGIESLAKRVHSLLGGQACVVVQDPHEHKWDVELIKNFRSVGGRQFKFVSMRPLHVMYKHAAVRARIQRSKLVVDPRCPHAIEVLEKHVYKQDGSGEADKVTCYSKSHMRESRKIQLVHLSDVLGYGCYKLFPTKVDFEKLERAA